MIEYSNGSPNGRRMIETAAGRREVRNPIEIGCPRELVEGIEKRNAARTGAVSDAEADELKARLNALKGL